jgi:hypothetical protein
MFLAILLLSSVVFASDQQAPCVISDKSVLSRSRSGVPQVSNVREVEITCHAPLRPWPSNLKPGSTRLPLRVKALAYQIGKDGARTVVPSSSNQTGGGFCGPARTDCAHEEWLWWSLRIPIDPAEAIAELRDGDNVWAVGQVELEVVFKGHVFDDMLGTPQQIK